MTSFELKYLCLLFFNFLTCLLLRLSDLSLKYVAGDCMRGKEQKNNYN